MQEIAEVVASSITSFVAECPKDASLSSAPVPYFGSLVCVDSQDRNLKYLAVVYNITTAPSDGVHRPVAFGMTREFLQKEQPQIFLLLQTQIHAWIVGFIRNGKGFPSAPPYPPRIHEFVYFADKNDLAKFGESFDFLRLLSEVNMGSTDEIIAAAIREAYLINNNDHRVLLKAGQALTQIFKSDSQRLLAILKRIQTVGIVEKYD